MPHQPANITKTRLAPTPSGYLHLGNVLSFAITAYLAEKNNAKILLRIDDIDRARVRPEYVQDIFDTLNYLAIPWHEGPKDAADFEQNYSQVHRMHLYNYALDQLKSNDKIYACSCSRSNMETCNCLSKNIPLDAKDVCWRLITDKQADIYVKDISGVVNEGFILPDEVRNFIVRKKDGFPAYQLTSVVDDLFYAVNLVVRGQDLWPSTLAQGALAAALGSEDFASIGFYHHPLINGVDGQKLSKSAGSTSVKYLRESGEQPAAIFALIAKMVGVKKHVSNWQGLGEEVLRSLA